MAMRPTFLKTIMVHQSFSNRQRAVLVAGAVRFHVAIGRSGMTHDKREGDGASPIGVFHLLRLWRRRDAKPYGRSGMIERSTSRSDLWCDANGHRLYNRPAKAPLAASHEQMWRADHLYDIVIEIGWNIRPRILGRGSAIFMHLARDGVSPTAGCVALLPRDMRKLLPLIGRRTKIILRR